MDYIFRNLLQQSQQTLARAKEQLKQAIPGSEPYEALYECIIDSQVQITELRRLLEATEPVQTPVETGAAPDIVTGVKTGGGL